MIVWSGWGILVIVFGFIGIIVGGIVGSAAGPLVGGVVGGGLAAFLNHLICKAVDKPSLKVDPQTGQQFLQKKSNSLFFVPMKYCTVLLAGAGLLIGVVGHGAARHDRELDAKYPGKKLFDAASDKIDTAAAEDYHGNTAKSQEAAKLYGDTLNMMEKMSFETEGSGGSINRRFLTYCNHSEHGLVFLCHVPDLKGYQDSEAKKGLVELAWASGQVAAKAIEGVNDQTPMVVGLRGFSSYEYVIKGSVGGDPQLTNEGEIPIYLAFDPTVSAAE